MRTSIQFAIALLLISLAQHTTADELTVDSLLTGLIRPTGVAIRPGGTAERYDVFVAEGGARRVVKVPSSRSKRSTEVITGFAAAPTAGERAGNPLCLIFLDEKHLVVGVAGEPPDVRIFELAELRAPITANQSKQQVTSELPQEDSDFVSATCVGLARTRANDSVPDMLLVAFGADHRGGLWKVPVRAGMLGPMSPLGTGPSASVKKPTAMVVNEQGYVVTTDWSSRSNKTLLLFINPASGQPALRLETTLSDVRGMAYSPKSGNLYAIGKTGGDEAEEGLFRMDDASKPAKPQISVVKVADIERPTGLAFGPDGALYVTSLGDDSDEGGGQLLKITGEL